MDPLSVTSDCCLRGTGVNKWSKKKRIKKERLA